jgi:hypothetical protein
MTKQSFDNATKTHRVAIATKTRGQAKSGHNSIPPTVDPATKAAAVKAAAAQHNTRKGTPK